MKRITFFRLLLAIVLFYAVYGERRTRCRRMPEVRGNVELAGNDSLKVVVHGCTHWNRAGCLFGRINFGGQHPVAYPLTDSAMKENVVIMD